MSNLLTMLESSDKDLFIGLAGPGTGKSHTFKTVVESSLYSGKKILILSFINKLVDDLVEDFEPFENVEVSTLHSFALSTFSNLTNSTEVELESDLDLIISDDHLMINGEDVDYVDSLYENNLSKAAEDFYGKRSTYYAHNAKLYSFNSIIYAVNSLLEDESKIPSDYDLILVDEFQDFNKLEFTLIDLLNKKNKLVLVGDDDQSLYDWKNAKPELIRELHLSDETDSFSLDHCYRCTEVIIKAVNSLVENASNNNFLQGRAAKKFEVPPALSQEKKELFEKYPKIDFIPCVAGHQLAYQLSKSIKADTEDSPGSRVLVIAPAHLKNSVYDGLIRNGFSVVEYELFANEEKNKIKHKKLIEAFSILAKRKTDNLSLRKVLVLYLSEEQQKELVSKTDSENKNIWQLLEPDVKTAIESDISLFKKVRTGKDELTQDELVRLNELFNLKNLLSKLIKGFSSVKKGSLEIEMTTAASSKGLSADYVYYLGIDDRDMFGKAGKLTDQKICEFLVGITRAKKKLTLFSLQDRNPKILELVGDQFLNVRNVRSVNK